jgi:PAS domain S-box-containing protein
MRLHVKLTLWIAVFSVVGGGTIALLVSNVMHDTLEQELEKRGVVIAETMAEHVTHKVIDGEVVAAREALQEIIQRTEDVEFAYVTGFDGEVFAHSFEDGFPRALLSHAHEHDLPHADAPCLERYETEEGLGLLVGYPLIEGMEAHIHVGLNETVLHDQVERTRNEIFGITVGVALVAALIGVFLSRSIAHPLERLSESLRAFGERRVERELDYRGGGREVADLTCAFNQTIAERVRAEEALRESEIKFRSLVENLPDVILVVARDGTILTINRMVTPSALPEQAIGRKVYDFVLPEHADRMKENIERVFQTGKPHSYEERGPGPQGPESAWYDIHLVPVWDDEQVISVMQISRDVTERKQAEEALRLERDNLINILEAMEDGVYIVNQQYDIQYVNPVLEKDFGPYEGRKCYAYFHEREEVCPWCKNQDVFAGKTVRWEWYSFKNQRTYDLIDTPLRNPDGSISKLEIFHDITAMADHL